MTTNLETSCWEMDDLRFRKIFNLGITKDIFRKEVIKIITRDPRIVQCF
jgi:hypothetical protein